MNRFTIQFTDKFDSLLSEIAKSDGITKAEAIRRSVAVYSFISKELLKGNRRLQIINDDTNEILQIVLPASLFMFDSPTTKPIEMDKKDVHRNNQEKRKRSIYPFRQISTLKKMEQQQMN